MATTDPETVVPEADVYHHHHHQAVEKKTTEEEPTNEVIIPPSKELEEAPTEDKLPVVAEVDEPPKLDVPVDTPSKEVEASFPDSEASSVLDAAGEQAEVKPETVAVEQVHDKASDLEAAKIEADNKVSPETTDNVPEEQPTLEPAHKEPEEVVECEVKEMLEEALEKKAAEEKTAPVEVESELKEVPAPKESTEIETSEKCEDESINPPTTEAADEQPVQNVDDVPVQDPHLEIKKEPEETPELLSQEVEQASGMDQVVDAPKGEPQEIKDIAEEVEPKVTQEVADIEVDKEEKSVPVVEAETDIKEAVVDKVVSESENAEAEGINTAAHENVAVEEIAKEEKDVKAEGHTKDENVPKAEESVPTETNNGFDRGETGGKLKDDSEEKHGDELNAEGLPPSQVDKLFEGEQVSRYLEVVKEEAKELEENTTGTIEPKTGSKDSQVETKVEETIKDMANEYEPTKTTAEEAKPDPSTLEASKNVGDETKATRDIPTTEVVKSSHKSSGNIISKVKQSLVKVKKAITGKSPSSKTSTTESKVEENVK